MTKTVLCNVALLAMLASCCPAQKPSDQPGWVKDEFIFEKAPFPSCHASTIVESKGSLVAAWFGGEKEKAPDVCIYVSRQVEGKWTPPVEVANGIQPDGPRLPCWNPVLFQPKAGPLMLFYKIGPDPRTWWGLLRTSDDGGKTWSRERRLPEGFLGPIKNKPVQLANGDILCPSSTESEGQKIKKRGEWRVHFERTDAAAKSWTQTAPPADGDDPINAIQPSLLRLGGDKLEALGRSRNGQLFETHSDDNGATWSELTLLPLPNPNSGTDAVTLSDGRHLLVYNHTKKGRSPLNVAISKDGRQWQAAAVLETEPGEYSYPACIQTSDGRVHITYTWKRQKIKHVVLDPAKLQLRPMADGDWPK